MCGFAGQFVYCGQGDLHLAQGMAATLTHRGPDEKGSFLSLDNRCAIGFRRLAVIDPPCSHQPMSETTGKITIAFNGEIYNFRKLREQLTSDGWQFRTSGDTEVVLAMYCKYGPEMFDKLDGMFAIAVYDEVAGRLVLGRDRLGQKPIWYATLADKILFASEAKAILADPSVQSHMSKDAVTDYLTFGYVTAPKSIWAGINKLEPGSVAVIESAEFQSKRYWSPSVVDIPDGRAEQLELVRTKVAEAVEARMVSDVPLGALLSGGLDSAIVVALMARAAGSTGGVRTFTAGFADPQYDERAMASLVAKHYRTEHTELEIQLNPITAVDEVLKMYDEPFADSSAIATHLICKAAGESVTVALAGDGGDEVFGGYDRYRALLLSQTMGNAAYLTTKLAALVARPFARGTERNRLKRLIRFADALPYPFSHQYFKYRNLFGPADLTRLFTDDFAEQVDCNGPAENFTELYEAGDFESEVPRAQMHDLLTYLPDDLLVKADIASMAASLELRSPFLDHDLVNLGLSLPVDMKVSRRQGKLILREAFADILPPEVLSAPKRGFGLPLARWLREDLQPMLKDVLLGPELQREGIFRIESLAGLINDHVRGKYDHSHRLWALLVLGRWLINRR